MANNITEKDFPLGKGSPTDHPKRQRLCQLANQNAGEYGQACGTAWTHPSGHHVRSKTSIINDIIAEVMPPDEEGGRYVSYKKDSKVWVVIDNKPNTMTGVRKLVGRLLNRAKNPLPFPPPTIPFPIKGRDDETEDTSSALQSAPEDGHYRVTPDAFDVAAMTGQKVSGSDDSLSVADGPNSRTAIDDDIDTVVANIPTGYCQISFDTHLNEFPIGMKEQKQFSMPDSIVSPNASLSECESKEDYSISLNSDVDQSVASLSKMIIEKHDSISVATSFHSSFNSNLDIDSFYMQLSQFSEMNHNQDDGRSGEAISYGSLYGKSVGTSPVLLYDNVQINFPPHYKRMRSGESFHSSEPAPCKPRLKLMRRSGGSVHSKEAVPCKFRLQQVDTETTGQCEEDELFEGEQVIDEQAFLPASKIELSTISSLTNSQDFIYCRFSARTAAKFIQRTLARIATSRNHPSRTKDFLLDVVKNKRHIAIMKHDSKMGIDVAGICEKWNKRLSLVFAHPTNETIAGQCVKKLVSLAILEDNTFMDHVSIEKSIRAVVWILKCDHGSAEINEGCCSLLTMIMAPRRDIVKMKELPYQDLVVDEALKMLRRCVDVDSLRHPSLILLHLLVTDETYDFESVTKNDMEDDAMRSVHLIIKLLGPYSICREAQGSFLRLLAGNNLARMDVTRWECKEIVRAMLRARDSALEVGCQVLARLSIGDSSSPCEVITAFMSHNRKHKMIQELACQALTHLTASDSIPVCYAPKCISVVAQAIHTHPDCIPIQQVGFEFFGKIVSRYSGSFPNRISDEQNSAAIKIILDMTKRKSYYVLLGKNGIKSLTHMLICESILKFLGHSPGNDLAPSPAPPQLERAFLRNGENLMSGDSEGRLPYTLQG